MLLLLVGCTPQSPSPETVPKPPIKLSTPEIPVLMYHILLEGQNDTISVEPKRFKEHMASLKKAGYNTISIFDLQNHIEKGAKLPKNPILITFDDGYISNYTEAYPILKEHDMKATVFVIASRIFDKKDISNGELEKFTWENAKEMKDTITIQSHTWDSHKKGKSITRKDRGMIASRLYFDKKLETKEEYEKRVYEDFVKANNVIKEKMGYEAISIAYPYGDYSADTIRIAQKAGYKLAFTVKDGLVTKKDQPLKLNRITASGAYSGKELIKVLQGQ